MAIADSALDYTATIKSISLFSSSMTVQYVSADSTDGREPVFRNIALGNTQFNDSDIQTIIKGEASAAARIWREKLDRDSDAPSFNDSEFVGETYNFRYKTSAVDSFPDYNPLTSKVVLGRTEDADTITTTYTVTALDSVEKVTLYEDLSMDRLSVIEKVRAAGNFDSAQNTFSRREIYHASWDASAGGSFDWSTDQIAAGGIKTVERVAEGTYRVVWATPQSSANYTVTTGIGNENYGGAGASPRQLTVISRATDSLQVHCERTDDAVDEDNAYMSVMMMSNDVNDIANTTWEEANTFTYNDAAMTKLQTMLGLSNDSDFVNFLVN